MCQTPEMWRGLECSLLSDTDDRNLDLNSAQGMGQEGPGWMPDSQGSDGQCFAISEK